MSDAMIILDSDEEQEEEQVKTSQLDYDEPLFEASAPSKKTVTKKQETKQHASDSDDFDSFLDSFHSNSAQNKATEISDEEVELTKDKTKTDSSRYARYLEDESPEASPSPPPSPKVQKKQSLKKPNTTKKKEQEEREDSMDAFIEQISEQEERENSTDELVRESRLLLTPNTGSSKRSLKNPIIHKKQNNSLDDDSISLARKREDSLERLLASSSTNKRRDSIDDILYPSTSSTSKIKNYLDDDDDDDLMDSPIGTAQKSTSIDSSSQKKVKRQESFEYEGDYMGTSSKSTFSHQKQPESIDLLSDDSDQHEEISRKPARLTPDDDKPRKYKPSSRFKPRKSSIDILLDEEMPTRTKPSYENMLHDSDSDTSLTTKNIVKKRRRSSSELSDGTDTSRKSRTKSSKTTSINAVNLDDDEDDDKLGSKSIHFSSSAFDNDDDDDDLDTDSFFNNLITMKKTGNSDTFLNKVETIASSSKSTSITDDDEPVIMDRKGKKRADAIRPSIRKRRDSIDDIANEDTLTPKEKRQLQIEKKKHEAQRKREEKNRLKEEKKREKEQQVLFEKANKIKNNRNDILKEMIVDIHPSFLITKPGQIIQQIMESKEAEVCPLDEECHQSISWRRKCTAEWDMDSQSFHPLPQTKLIEEPVVLLFFQVNLFIQHIMEDTLENTISRIKRSHRNKQIMMMIEGLETYYKKKKSSESRQFQQTVRERINNSDSTTSNNRRKKKTSIYETGPKKNEVEDVLVELQMMHDIMLISTKSDADSANWLESLTIDLALGRYKTKNINNTYRVTRTGKGASDTFFKMLQEVHLCTPAVAKSIMSTYPSAQKLYKAYKRTSRGSELLADLEVERSAVQVRDRTINKVMSKKMHSIFTSTDPEHVIF